MEAIKDRFLKKVVPEPNTGCWIWLGTKHARGYGQFGMFGKMIYAHRVSFLIEHGFLDNASYVCHRCDNPWCVNPEHLFLGTQADNMADMYKKGRGPKHSGEFNGNSKLTWEDVEDIRKSTEKQSYLAKKYGVNQTQISKIKIGKNWRR